MRVLLRWCMARSHVSFSPVLGFVYLETEAYRSSSTRLEYYASLRMPPYRNRTKCKTVDYSLNFLNSRSAGSFAVTRRLLTGKEGTFIRVHRVTMTLANTQVFQERSSRHREPNAHSISAYFSTSGFDNFNTSMTSLQSDFRSCFPSSLLTSSPVLIPPSVSEDSNSTLPNQVLTPGTHHLSTTSVIIFLVHIIAAR